MYVVFQEIKTGLTYWTGGITETGKPQQKKNRSAAKEFQTARKAYEEAGKYGRLYDFRVGKR